VESPYIDQSVIESPVGLVLVEAAGVSNAMTVSCFSALAHFPAALCVSIARSSFTHGLIEAAGQFSLIVLSVAQQEIARHCGSISGRNQEKCSALNLYRSPSGFLFLEGAPSSTACRVREKIDLGEHTLFVADIVEGDVDSRQSRLRHLLLSDMRTYAVAS
jgi:flavin reductase (DIM6/NTAB) family NADH-FMN oxidoreductase RutF